MRKMKKKEKKGIKEWKILHDFDFEIDSLCLSREAPNNKCKSGMPKLWGHDNKNVPFPKDLRFEMFVLLGLARTFVLLCCLYHTSALNSCKGRSAK